VITYEFEHINVDALKKIESAGRIIYPSVAALSVIQDKYSQKSALKAGNVPVPDFVRIHDLNDIFDAATLFGYPMMLKTTRGGYDGKGNAPVRSEGEAEEAFRLLGAGTKEMMAERFVDFEKEISIIACRGADGTRAVYPVAENIHINSILDTTTVPAGISPLAAGKAAAIADKVMEIFDGVGTFCIEMFVTVAGGIYVNEVAPRPHNSGHYTIEGCFSNQFENHIRAVAGLPFGKTELKQPTVMVNLLGQSDGPAQLIGLEQAYLDPDIKVHFYGKKESKIGRKMGHFTVVDETPEGAAAKAEKAKKLLKVIGGNINA